MKTKFPSRTQKIIAFEHDQTGQKRARDTHTNIYIYIHTYIHIHIVIVTGNFV